MGTITFTFVTLAAEWYSFPPHSYPLGIRNAHFNFTGDWEHLPVYELNNAEYSNIITSAVLYFYVTIDGYSFGFLLDYFFFRINFDEVWSNEKYFLLKKWNHSLWEINVVNKERTEESRSRIFNYLKLCIYYFQFLLHFLHLNKGSSTPRRQIVARSCHWFF